MAIRVVRHRRTRKMGGIDSGTLMLIGAGAVALYLFTRPKTTQTYYPGTMIPYNPVAASSAAAQAASQASTTNTAITQGASVVTDLINQIFG